MAEIIPFRAILYNKDKVGGGSVIAPPYDIITPEMRDSLYAESPFNVVRIDSGKELPGDGEGENKYTRAGRFMEDWLREGILIRGDRPAFYAFKMDYEIRGRKKSLKGLFGLVRVVDLGKGVYPHEATYSKPKLDRLSLMEVSGANTSPIFSIYNSPASLERGVSRVLAAAVSGEPYLQAGVEGMTSGLWPIEDKDAIEEIKKDLADKPVFIADGHHRYETALEYRDRLREKAGPSGVKGPSGPFDYVLMFLANSAVEDLTILPTHRLVSPVLDGAKLEMLSGHFGVEKLPPDADIIAAMEGQRHVFGLYSAGQSYLLRHKGLDLSDVHPALRKLDVVILHEMILKRDLGIEGFGYEMDYALARAKVQRGEYGAAFFLNPTEVGNVEEVALSMLRMPPKSTYFYPKVPTGFVINSLRSF